MNIIKTRIKVFFYSSGFTLVMIALFAGVGYLLDQKFGGGHKFLVAGLMLSYPLTQLALYRKFKRK